MTSGLFEWVVRTAMLVLAGLVTLSILGSIAAMSNDPGGGSRTPPGDLPAPAPSPSPDAAPAPPADARPAGASAAGAPPAGASAPGGATAAAPRQDDPSQRWLEAISYALLALAGLAAIGLLLLWRGARQLRRIADALEARPRN